MPAPLGSQAFKGQSGVTVLYIEWFQVSWMLEKGVKKGGPRIGGRHTLLVESP